MNRIEKLEKRRRVRALMRRVSGAKDDEVRKAAAMALGRIGEPAAIRSLGKAVEDGNAYLGRKAVKALGMIRHVDAVRALVEILARSGVGLQNAAERSLCSQGSFVVQELVTAFEKNDAPAFRASVARILLKAGWKPHTKVHYFYVNLNRGSAALIADMGPEVVPSLIDSLEIRNRQVKRTAIAALGLLADQRAIGPLSEVLTKDKDDDVLTAAATALGKHGEEAIVSLVEAIDNSFGGTAIIDALAEIGGMRAFDAVATLAKSDAKFSHRESIAMAMTKLGDNGISWLEWKLASSDFRWAAIEALELIGWHPKSLTSRALWAIVKDDWQQLVDIGRPSVKPLKREICGRVFPLERIEKLADTLSEIGGHAAGEALMSALEVHGGVGYLRGGQIADVLEKRADERLSERLAKIIVQSHEASAHAVRVLESIFSRRPDGVPDRTLHIMARQKDLSIQHRDFDYDEPDEKLRNAIYTQEVDLAKLRRLAKQELNRRASRGTSSDRKS